MSKGKKNVYVCSACGHQTVTIDIDEGTTPFMISCIKCDEAAYSQFYADGAQGMTPTHEWRKPAEKEREELLKLSPETLTEHVDRGGLLLYEKDSDISFTTKFFRNLQ